jgi:hypothetical protein
VEELFAFCMQWSRHPHLRLNYIPNGRQMRDCFKRFSAFRGQKVPKLNKLLQIGLGLDSSIFNAVRLQIVGKRRG